MVGGGVNAVAFKAFADELEKIAQGEWGIPDREITKPIPELKKPTIWEFGIHSHEARKRGHHFDLRLGDPKTGHAHSWAMPPKMPAPGENQVVIQQPTHALSYMDFKGVIPEGYGAGKVGLHAREQTEVMESSPEHVKFNVYRPSGPEEYTLKRLGGRIWKLFNMTPTSKKLGIEFGKPDYKEIKPEKLDVTDDRYLMSAKIDDAHNLFVFPDSGRHVRVVSYRQRKRPMASDLIEHTHKLPDLRTALVPAGLGGTVLRGGVFAIHPETGKATDAHILGGLLNSDVWKSRKKQEAQGTLKAVLYDVERYRGRDVSKAPYDKKLSILREVVKKLPQFELPPMAETEAEKKALLKKIESGKLPETSEGVVLWRKKEYEPATKVKFKEQHDVFVRRFFPGEGKYSNRGVGGFEFSHTPDGPIVGKVGTGLSDRLREDMHKHPDRYLDSVAVLESMTKYKSGALRAPAFKNWHLDKNGDKLDRMVAR